MWQDSGRDAPDADIPEDDDAADDDTAGDDPPFRRVAAALRERIATDLGPGARIPSVRALVHEFGVASATASRAVALLRDEGLVETLPRVGTVVATRAVRRRATRRPAAGPPRTAGRSSRWPSSSPTRTVSRPSRCAGSRTSSGVRR